MSVWAPAGRSARYLTPRFLQFTQLIVSPLIRKASSIEAIEKRNHLFSLEKKRQQESVGRIEKIEVRYLGTPKDVTMFMNKDISTPFDCARHLSLNLVQRSALALIDGSIVWDMQRPLTHSCSLELLNFMINDPTKVNTAFWRTCSFALGATAAKAFKNNFEVKLHSFPTPDVRSGSFVYDVELCSLSDWEPSQQDLKVLSGEFIRLTQSDTPIERLSVSRDLAQLMFEDNEHKSRQIPDIAQKNEGQVTLYRAGNHIDISKGPMIGNLNLIGRVTIAAIHKLSGILDDKNLTLHRFQGVALPVGIIINHMAYNILEERAKKMNPAKSPFEPFYSEVDDSQSYNQAIA
ncbi:mitochondrial ribosomal protein L39 [Arctopsyche grandis]|uniref:mitochondrial ribosomal protein L39 n=1 Tax=Arctopsyche grandis TaxID=121162 RepID=UPI00406D80F7